ncbi:MAG: hypothetical protein WC789_09525 [Lentisphaeria bacterium]
MNENQDTPRWRCTVCGQVGSVGRCCGCDTRAPLNEAARVEAEAEDRRKHEMEAGREFRTTAVSKQKAGTLGVLAGEKEAGR